MDNWVDFNVNDAVRVKLTPRGHQILADRIRELEALIPSPALIPPVPLSEDDDGWSEWQLWLLMKTFGPHARVGCEPAFEAQIQLKPRQETA